MSFGSDALFSAFESDGWSANKSQEKVGAKVEVAFILSDDKACNCFSKTIIDSE